VAVALSASSEPPSRPTTTALTTVSPTTHPSAKATPLTRARDVPRTTTIATIGIGLRATATAAGRRSPIAWLNTPVSVGVERVP
jgi:hypothetical protein